METGCAYGVSKKEILERLQERLNISCQTAQEYFARYSGKKISESEAARDRVLTDRCTSTQV